MDQEFKDKVMKSGTSILGIVCKDGIVMASDRRSTAGNLVMNKNKQKTVKLNDYLVVSGTGMASDIDMIQKLVTAELRLKELGSKQRPSVGQAANLFGNIAYRSIRQPTMIPFIAGTLVAGVNEDGTTELYTIEPAGTAEKVDEYDANFGSGMPFILGLLERGYKKDMSVKEGVDLAVEAIKSSTQRDTGSGNGIDVFVITKDGINQVVKKQISPELK